MKQFFLLLILIGLGTWAYYHYYGASNDGGAEAAAHEPHLAKQGTFYVLEYVAVPAAHGVIGFEPGREVHFVRTDHERGLLVVSDGQYEVEMKPSQLTNDMDIAALARNGDESSQHQIHTFLEHERAVYEAATKAANLKYAAAMDLANRRMKGLPVGSPSPAPSNPYSYLTR